MSSTIPDDVMERAEEIHRDASEFNRFTWHGPWRDELREVVDYVWRVAHETGYQRGLEDGGA